MTLRSAYSETRQFLYSEGNTTLTLAAAAGDTDLKVGAVNNFIVGDTLRIGSDTATITAVGTQARSSTLFAAAPAGATNVKVAATTGLAAAIPCGSTARRSRSPLSALRAATPLCRLRPRPGRRTSRSRA